MTEPVGEISAEALSEELPSFAALLHACVHAGANINFVLPFPIEEAEAFWRRTVVPALGEGRRVLWAARLEGRIAGAAQLHLEMPPNQGHRAEVSKLMVHPDFRRRGLGRALMAAVEARARAERRSLLTLDTRSGSEAEPLYTSLGYVTVGQIPGFCRDPILPRLDPTTVMYKELRSP